jgi:hypothetical protein
MMKKSTLIALAFVLLLSSTALAHPPKKAECNFDLKKGIFTATIPHDVDQPTKHYIDSVKFTIERKRKDPESGKIKKQEQELKVEYKVQTSKDAHTIMIPIANVLVGDRIIMKANCSQFGWKTTKYTVPEPKPEEASEKDKSPNDSEE